MTNSFVVGPREETFTVYGGTSYGKGHLLVEGDGVRLFFVPGHSVYTTRATGTVYSRCCLYLCRDDMAFRRRKVLEIEGERLSKKLLAREDVRKAVADMWGEAVAAALNPKATIRVARPA